MTNNMEIADLKHFLYFDISTNRFFHKKFKKKTSSMTVLKSCLSITGSIKNKQQHILIHE